MKSSVPSSSSPLPSSAPSRPRHYRKPFGTTNTAVIEKQIPLSREIVTVLGDLLESDTSEFLDLPSGGLIIHDNQAFIPPKDRSIDQFCILLYRPLHDFPYSFLVDKSSFEIITARQVGRISGDKSLAPRNAIDDKLAFQGLYQVLREASMRLKINAIIPDDSKDESTSG